MARRFERRLLSLVLLLLAGSGTVCAQGNSEERNVVSFDFEMQQGVDDNAFRTETVSHLLGLIPHLKYRHNRQRGYWSFDYRTTFRRFSNLSVDDEIGHQLYLDATVALSKRLHVNFQQSFLSSTNPFLRVVGNNEGELSADDVLFGPNRGFVGPERSFTQLNSTVGFQYRLGQHSSLDFVANYYRDEQSGEGLNDHETQSFRLGYGKQYAGNKSWQTKYSYQQFRSSASNERVRTHSILFSHHYEFKSGAELELFAGPQVSVVESEPTVELNIFPFIFRTQLRVRERVNSLALGAVLTRRLNERTWTEFSISRRVSEGGGFISTVIQTSSRLTLRRQLTRRLSASLSGFVTQNRSLETVVSDSNLRTVGVSPGIRYDLSRHAGLRVQYQFSRFWSASGPLQVQMSRNQLTVGIFYSFGDQSL